jgi:hypothetical protein
MASRLEPGEAGPHAAPRPWDSIPPLAEQAPSPAGSRSGLSIIAPSRMPLTPSTRLGAYEITGPLGAGGMGETLCRW